MATVRVNGIDLYYEMQGEGEPVLLVHGGFGDHESWAFVVPHLVDSYRVVTCDLRGHSASAAPPPVRMADYVADVAALIEALDLAPAHVVGYSLGAGIVLRLASERPELVASVCAHEPPAMSAFASRADTRVSLYDMVAMFTRLFDRVEADPKRGVREFTDVVAPGVWEQLPVDIRARMIANSAAYLPTDFDALEIDLERLAACSRPVLLTDGGESPAFFPAITRALEEAVPSLAHRTIPGAGHVPHFTHPAEFAAVVRSVAGVAAVR